MLADEKATYIKVSARDIEVGKPLPWSLYDGNRKLLLKRGYVIENQRQCDILVENGLYRNAYGREMEGPRQAPAAKPAEDDGLGAREAKTSLEGSRIRIGDLIQLQSSSSAPRYYVKLIGYLKGKGVIVSAPEADGELVMIKEGQSFIARFFSGQNAYAFTANVTRQTSVPFPHIHLSYPREIRGLEVRKGSRINTDLIAAIAMSKGEQIAAASAKIINLSTGGAALRSKTTLGHKGDIINVKFKIDVEDIDSYLVFDSVIRANSYDASDPAMPYFYGIEFVNVEHVMAMALAAYVYKQMADNAKG